MLGMLRLRQDTAAPRICKERREILGTVDFYTVIVRIHGDYGYFDRRILRQAIRKFAAQDIKLIAAPQTPYINTLLARYDMRAAEHWELLRALAPQMIDYVLSGNPHGAVLLCAQQPDEAVLTAAHYAARHYRTVMLEMGIHGEYLRRTLMEIYGTAALLSAIDSGAAQTVALFFDKPERDFHRIIPRLTTLALCPQAMPDADFDELKLEQTPYGSFADTDENSVLQLAMQTQDGISDYLTIAALRKRT